MHYIKTLSSTEMTGTGKSGQKELLPAKNAILFKKDPPYLKNPENMDLKSPKNPRVF